MINGLWVTGMGPNDFSKENVDIGGREDGPRWSAEGHQAREIGGRPGQCVKSVKPRKGAVSGREARWHQMLVRGQEDNGGLGLTVFGKEELTTDLGRSSFLRNGGIRSQIAVD